MNTTIPNNILNLTLGEVGTPETFKWWYWITEGTKGRLEDSESIEISDETRELQGRRRGNPSLTKHELERGYSEAKDTTIREILEGWEEKYEFYTTQPSSGIIGLFRSSMVTFFNELLTIGVTDEQLGEIVGAREEIRLQEAADRLRSEAIRVSSQHPPVDL